MNDEVEFAILDILWRLCREVQKEVEASKQHRTHEISPEELLRIAEKKLRILRKRGMEKRENDD